MRWTTWGGGVANASYHLPMARREGLGTDADYLRDHQYKDPSNLNARIALHAKYSRCGRTLVPVADRPHRMGTRLPGTRGRLRLRRALGQRGRLLPRVQLTLTDLSAGMVDAATAAVAPLPNIELADARTCDAQELPFDDGAFDVVVANHMLYHVPDPTRAAAEFARVLDAQRRPDGGDQRAAPPRCRP